jgi:hypothetical protein
MLVLAQKTLLSAVGYSKHYILLAPEQGVDGFSPGHRMAALVMYFCIAERSARTTFPDLQNFRSGRVGCSMLTVGCNLPD